MRIFENKESELNGKKITYFDFLRIIIENPPQGGFNPSDMRKAIEFIGRIETSEKDGNAIEFSQSEFDKLKIMWENCRWMVVSKHIIEFGEALLNMPEKPDDKGN